jgi:hypothetical protein
MSTLALRHRLLIQVPSSFALHSPRARVSRCAAAQELRGRTRGGRASASGALPVKTRRHLQRRAHRGRRRHPALPVKIGDISGAWPAAGWATASGAAGGRSATSPALGPEHSPRVRATRCAAAHENSDQTTGRTGSITTDRDAAQTGNGLPNAVTRGSTVARSLASASIAIGNDFALTHATRAWRRWVRHETAHPPLFPASRVRDGMD